MISKFISIIFIVSIIHGVLGISVFQKYPSVSLSSEDFDYDDDMKYPVDQLNKVIEQTKEILMSDDEQKKNKLKIDTSFYKVYLSGKNLEGNKMKFIKKKTTKCDAIRVKSNYKRLVDVDGKEQWIIHGKYLEQETYEIYCAEEGGSCDVKPPPPLGYERKCKQLIKDLPLISIPVDEKLTPENQRLATYSLRYDCECKTSRVWNNL